MSVKNHLEYEGCIVNITEGLTDMKGRTVTSIQIIPDGKRYGDNWKLVGTLNNRIIKLKKGGGY